MYFLTPVLSHSLDGLDRLLSYENANIQIIITGASERIQTKSLGSLLKACISA